LAHGQKSYANVHIQPSFKCDPRRLSHQLRRIAKTIHTQARPAKASYSPGVGVVVTKLEQPGIDLDETATEAALLRNGSVWSPNGTTAPTTLVIHETEPPLRQADLSRVDTLLGSFHTDYGSSSPNRRHNVELAASHIDGTLLAPGQVFSYNDIVGPRETKLGWLDAPTYQDGQVVPGPGGGVCQTSTTLYNAVLRAGLKVVMRSHHSMPVHYVEPGRDATVAYDDLDFRFRNTTDAPILVGASARSGKLTFNLYGTGAASPGQIELASSGHTPTPDGGFTVTTYRVLKAPDGTISRDKISTDTYAPPPSASKKPAKATKTDLPGSGKKRRTTPVKSVPTASPTAAPATEAGATSA
jgi:vancomycin resistance protein YoaR